MMQIGMNARLFPGNWRPVRREIEFAQVHHFAAIQLPGPEQGLDAARLGDSLPFVAAALQQAKLTVVMEMVVRIDERGQTALGASPLEVLQANLPAITTLPCHFVHWHLVPIQTMPEEATRAVERQLIPQSMAALALAQEHSFHFAFEHNEPSLGLYGTPDACTDLLTAVPGLQFVWDFNHTTPEHLAQFLALIPRMSVLHISDTPLPAVNHHLPLGLGNIQFGAYCQALRHGNFRGPAILEIGGLPQSGGYGRDTDAALIDSQQRLSEIIRAL
ncbi:MAG: TIM barrel protein [Chloroflexi bacterium]|nr:TIM barrel protein [Chloroflexota bacterium]